MNPLRLDVLGIAILLSVPFLAGGNLSADEMVTRFAICWIASTVGVGLISMHLSAAKAEADRLAKIKADLDALTASDDDGSGTDGDDTAASEPQKSVSATSAPSAGSSPEGDAAAA
jgi:hypothetical protein